MTGYLAFPPSNTDPSFPTQRPPLSFIQESQADAYNKHTREQQDAEEQTKLKEEEARKRVGREEKRRQRCERNRHQAWLSELEWVRSGGTLRDDRGRRDVARTEEMRREIRLQEEERRIKEMWDTYETRWRSFLSGTTSGADASIGWDDIPWPVHETPLSSADLTPDAIAEFLFAPLSIRGSTGSKKERIRSSFLRWHPDKFPAAVLSQMSEDERVVVVDGVNSVFMALKLIQDVEKRTS